MSDWDRPPLTYLHSVRRTSVSGSPNATTLSMTEEELEAAKEREAIKRPPFGFARELEREP